MLPENTILQGRYQILEPIGRGGMGAVYKALDTRLRAVVALKETLVSGEVLARAFEREAQLLAGLRHPALPRVSDHFTEGEGQFLVMEFIPGADLGKLMSQREGPFPVEDATRWADSLLDALDYLHGHTPPIVHRDIKPQNMKLTDRGEIILLDFGLAKGAAAQATRSASTSSIFGYTPHYAPLEQIKGTGTDPRSDLYSLAATIHHLLTGAPPPDALTRAAAKINEEPDPLTPAHLLNPDVPPWLSGILMKAMSQRPDQRYRSAAMMRAALRARDAGVPTDELSPGTAKLTDPNDTMVMVSRAPETVAARTAPVTLAPTAPPSTGTTVSNPPGAPAPGRPGWALPAAIGGGLLAVAASLALVFGGGGSPGPTPTASLPGGQAIVAVATATETPPPTETPLPVATLTEQELLQTAEVLQTAEIQKREAEIATARALVNAIDGAQTQTVIALTPTATAYPPTETPAPATAAPTEPPRPPTSTPDLSAPTRTPRPTQTPAPPTNTPTPDAPDPVVIASGGGQLFRGTADFGAIAADATGGGSCIQGRVRTAGGGVFDRFGVQVDLRGNTREARIGGDGTYSICGLAAGEWGVSIFNAGGVDISGSEQAAHQVRVQLTGTPGEVAYVNFQALPAFAPPPPTPTQVVGPYDGRWSGRISGTTTTGSFTGNFRMEVRANTIYSISVDGASCFFDTYPNFPRGQAIAGNAIAASGPVFNPQDNSKGDITYAVSGTFNSDSAAAGTFNASQGGTQCILGSWSASKVAGP